MDDADARWREGDIDGARAALVARVKAAPADVPTRMFLFQLMALAGDWDKARLQLETLARLSPASQMLAVAYGQAIDAERQRAAAMAGEVEVPVLARVGDWINDLAAALGHAARGEADAAAARREAALDAAPDTAGSIEIAGEAEAIAFDWIADTDARFGPAAEAIIGGRWGLLPFDAVEQLTSAGAADLRDTIWFPAEIRLRAGGSVAALLPARYPGSHAAAEIGHIMGTRTDWDARGHGIGQHVLMTSGGAEFGLTAIRRLTLTDAR